MARAKLMLDGGMAGRNFGVPTATVPQKTINPVSPPGAVPAPAPAPMAAAPTSAPEWSEASGSYSNYVASTAAPPVIAAPPPAPVAAPVAAPAANLPGQSWSDFAAATGLDQSSNVRSPVLAMQSLGSQIGFQGPSTIKTTGQGGWNESSGSYNTVEGESINPELVKALENYRVQKTGAADPSMQLTDNSGKAVGGEVRYGDSPGKAMKIAGAVIPALVGAGFGFGGLEALGLIGGGGGAAAGAGAAEGGLAGLGELGINTALGAEAGMAGTGGLSGLGELGINTALTGGAEAGATGALGIPGASYALPGAESSFGLSNIGAAAGEAGIGQTALPSFLEPGASFLGETVGAAPGLTPNLAGGLGSVETGSGFLGGGSFLGEAVPAAAPSFSGMSGPALNDSIARALAEVNTPPAATPPAAVSPPATVPGLEGPMQAPYTTAAADSQLANTAMQAAGTPLAAATPPAGVNLGSLGGIMSTAGGVSGVVDALKSGASSLGSFVKENPQLAGLGISGATTLLGNLNTPTAPSVPGVSGGGSNAALIQALTDKLYGPNGSMTGSCDYSSVPGLKTSAGDPNQFNQQASDAAYANATRYLDPQIQQQQRALEARLSEQGFVPGTPGYNQAMQNFMDTNQRAYASARDTSTLQGFAQGNSAFGQSLSNANLNNSASRETLAQLLAQRNQPLNELNALKTGEQVNYQNQLDQYGAKVAESNSNNQALSQLALALGMYLGG